MCLSMSLVDFDHIDVPSMQKPEMSIYQLENSLTSTTFAYKKLPQQHFKLSVIKLNGSCFDVEVGVMATVAELKQSVEYVFSHSSDNRHLNISWSHVWGHFCLCYEGQKLNDDKEHIRYLGIGDGDKLYFVRHLAVNFKPDDRLTKEGTATYKQITVT